MVQPRTFEELVAEGVSVPVEGWDVSWFEGRANEERPPWGYARLLVDDDNVLPFDDETFDLVVSRHPVLTIWEEVARVLYPDGSYLSQQIGQGSNRELFEFMMGPQPSGDNQSPERVAKCAEAAGLVVVDLRQASLRTVFNDLGAVVHFLRKVPWTVPGFTAERYRDQLLGLHGLIERDGPFVAHAERFFIETRKPARRLGRGRLVREPGKTSV